jgi:hypothetical protein
MLETDMHEIARKMRGPGGGRVAVLDVDYSSRKYGIALGGRASRHAYYLRPADGMDATDLKSLLDEAGGEAKLTFRYYIYPELHTDLKPILTADPFAEKYFFRNDDRRFLQIEGERPKARERIAELLDGLKEPFNPEDFPRINEFVLSSFRPSTEGRHAEVVLRRKDGNRDGLRRSEPGFHIAVAEHGLAKEIEIYRPVVAESEPTIMLNSNENTSDLGHKFLSDLAAYFGSPGYAEQSQLVESETAVPALPAINTRAPGLTPPRAPRIQAATVDEQQLITKVAAAMKELLPGMKLLQKREVSRSGPYLTIQFPGMLGFGKGPSAKEIKELESVFRALRGDPSFGSGWQARYQVNRETGEMRISTSLDPASANGWTAL